MPSFGLFQTPQSHSLSSSVDPNISAQMQPFRRRQDYLVASTQRRIQQEAELARKHHHEPENFIGSLQQSTPPLADPYHHRASLSVNFESSVHHDAATRNIEYPSNIQQHPYRDSRGSEPASVDGYSYVHDISQAIPYATALSTTLFRHPSVIELESRRKSVPPV